MDETAMPEVQMEESRSSSIHIPTEVCENIIDMLFSYHTGDTVTNIATLHSCALVCRDWRVRSQRMLFYQVQLADTTSFQRLSKILDLGPHLRNYVYKVQLTGYHLHNTTSIFALFPAVFAGKLPNLYRIHVVHFSDTMETQFPRTPGSPKAKAIPYIPLHPHFPVFLSAFTTMSELVLKDTTFRTFSEFVRMLHGLPNLEQLACASVRWIAPGGSHPGADFTRQPDCVTGKGTLPPFAPKLRRLELYDIALYGAKTLIWTRGPHLTLLSLMIPLLSDPEELSDSCKLDLGSCTGLEQLILYITSQFSVDTHCEFVAELLASWKPQHCHPVLHLAPYVASETTRQGFADALRGFAAITEAWLQALEELPPTGSIGYHQHRKCQVEVGMYEWDSRRRWWLDHLESCFPTFMKLGRVKLTIDTPQYAGDEWHDEAEPAQSGVATASQVKEVKSSPISKDTPSTKMTDPELSGRLARWRPRILFERVRVTLGRQQSIVKIKEWCIRRLKEDSRDGYGDREEGDGKDRRGPECAGCTRRAMYRDVTLTAFNPDV